ncbi:MAG: Rpn family recombination-promoting nuclease/putative transposase [Kiritimatiellae bacterium]|jgi:predicted transposase/invertase (TIGR01784 family)|nr:Rpn family recombination-promoting nuclease/putative transposase [Kiritimatiellia bacterium]
MEYLKEKYINFFTDFGFKKLFGSEPSKDCLIDFLNSLLEGMEEPIKELQFRKSENIGASEIDRRAIFDLYCVSETGSRFIVELQKAKQKFFKDRSVFYSTFPIQEQAKKGDWNFKLDAVYTIGILDFVFEDDSDTPEKYLYNVKLSELDSHEVFYDKLTFVYIEMPRFKKSLSELKTHQDKWIYALKNLSNLTGVPEGFREDVFLKFFDIAEIAQLDPVERDSYEDSLKVYRDLKNTIDTALEEGWEGGLEKGRAEGIVTVAKNLLESGMSLENVAKMTGLSVDEVNQLL